MRPPAGDAITIADVAAGVWRFPDMVIAASPQMTMSENR
jgi:hypothetical protein